MSLRDDLLGLAKDAVKAKYAPGSLSATPQSVAGDGTMHTAGERQSVVANPTTPAPAGAFGVEWKSWAIGGAVLAAVALAVVLVRK